MLPGKIYKMKKQNSVHKFTKNSIALSLFLLLSCNLSDYTEDLGYGYSYVHESATESRIYKNFDSGYFEISPTIIEYKINDKYIYCKQMVNINREDAYKHSVQYLYWLINKVNDDVYKSDDSLEFYEYCVGKINSSSSQ